MGGHNRPWTAAPNLQSVGHSAGYVPKHVAGILQPPLQAFS